MVVVPEFVVEVDSSSHMDHFPVTLEMSGVCALTEGRYSVGCAPLVWYGSNGVL